MTGDPICSICGESLGSGELDLDELRGKMYPKNCQKMPSNLPPSSTFAATQTRLNIDFLPRLKIFLL